MENNLKSSLTIHAQDREIIFTRAFDAPRGLVFYERLTVLLQMLLREPRKENP
jgi:hypothetical protein